MEGKGGGDGKEDGEGLRVDVGEDKGGVGL
jgi:hypothetical protein